MADEITTPIQPVVFDKMTATEAASLQTHVDARDELGFFRLALSFGWDEDTVRAVWNYMYHKISENEVEEAFGED